MCFGLFFGGVNSNIEGGIFRIPTIGQKFAIVVASSVYQDCKNLPIDESM
jgi:hypothetical protein